MTVRELLGFVLLVFAVALVPMGWHASLLGLILGVSLFYTERMRKREERIEKEGTDSAQGCECWSEPDYVQERDG